MAVTQITADVLTDGILTADATGRAKMADNFVNAAKILADAVTTVKILDANVTTAKIAADAVDYTKVAAGAVVQVVNTITGAVSTGTTTIPFDDTIPQNTEGDQYMTLAITPKSTTNKLKIEVVFFGSCSTSGATVGAALFQDTTANALAASFHTQTSTATFGIKFTHYMAAGTTSSTAFKVRAGGPSGTLTFNGNAAARIYGGVMASSITITEIKA